MDIIVLLKQLRELDYGFKIFIILYYDHVYIFL